MTVLTALALAWLAFAPISAKSPQEATKQDGLVPLLHELEMRTAQRRQMAKEAWESLFPTYLKHPTEGTLSPLLKFAPEIQEPALIWVRSQTTEAEQPQSTRAGLLLLREAMNSAGAEELLALLPDLIPEDRAQALSIIIERGDSATHEKCSTYLDGDNAALSRAAMDSFARFGDLNLVPIQLQRVPHALMDSRTADAILASLMERPWGEEHHLPESWLSESGPSSTYALAAFLAVYPDDHAQDLLEDWTFDQSVEEEIRKNAIQALEKGAKPFKWRGSTRRLGDHLRRNPKDSLATTIAWSLHRLGENSGSSFLLSEPESKVKRNPKDWRARLQLGEVLVELGDFKKGYKEYSRCFDDLVGTASYKQLSSKD